MVKRQLGGDPRRRPLHREIIGRLRPVWAIGTGKTATPEQAQAVHAVLRANCAPHRWRSQTRRNRILYGGRTHERQCGRALAQPDIDGGLIGGASLKAAGFLSIIAAAPRLAPGSQNHGQVCSTPLIVQRSRPRRLAMIGLILMQHGKAPTPVPRLAVAARPESVRRARAAPTLFAHHGGAWPRLLRLGILLAPGLFQTWPAGRSSSVLETAAPQPPWLPCAARCRPDPGQ